MRGEESVSSPSTEDPDDMDDSTITTVLSGFDYDEQCYFTNGEEEEENKSSDETRTSNNTETTPAEELPPYAPPPEAIRVRPLPAVPRHIRRQHQAIRDDYGLRLPLWPHNTDREILEWQIGEYCDVCGDTGIMGDLCRICVDGSTRYADMMPVWEE